MSKHGSYGQVKGANKGAKGTRSGGWSGDQTDVQSVSVGGAGGKHYEYTQKKGRGGQTKG